MALMVKNLPAMQEAQVRFLGWEDTLEKGMTAHSSILAWRIPWTKETGYSPWDCKELDRTEWLTHTHGWISRLSILWLLMLVCPVVCSLWVQGAESRGGSHVLWEVQKDSPCLLYLIWPVVTSLASFLPFFALPGELQAYWPPGCFLRCLSQPLHWVFLLPGRLFCQVCVGPQHLLSEASSNQTCIQKAYILISGLPLRSTCFSHHSFLRIHTLICVPWSRMP